MPLRPGGSCHDGDGGWRNGQEITYVKYAGYRPGSGAGRGGGAPEPR